MATPRPRSTMASVRSWWCGLLCLAMLAACGPDIVDDERGAGSGAAGTTTSTADSPDPTDPAAHPQPADPPDPVPPRSTPVVLYYADSIGSESMADTQLALGDEAQLVDRSYPGSALCDWREGMPEDHERWQPDLVVLQFVGNHMTPCSMSDDPIVETPQHYAVDVAAVVELWADDDVPIVWMSAPRSLFEPLALIQDGLDIVYSTSAATHPLVTFADPGAVLESAAGQGVARLPCAWWETDEHGCEGGEISVRHADGIHLCQAGNEVCPGYAAGQFRYGSTVAEVVRRHL